MNPRNLSGWAHHAQYDEAATLAYMRSAPADIGPALLLLFHAQDCSQFWRVHLHGFGYLQAWARAHGIPARREVLEYAAGDALAVLWCRRAPKPVSERSRDLHIRSGSYYELRSVAQSMFLGALQDARWRFLTGTIHTCRSPYSETGSAPAKSSRAAPGKAQLSLSFDKAA